jgi:threonine/homoserine/homoserine lactone efflux protein
MNPLEGLFRGAVAGLAISAPVGPVNVLCVSRAVAKGRLAGLICGLGAATADTFYGAIAAFSISFVIRFLISEEKWIHLFGGAILIVIGILFYCKAPRTLKAAQEQTLTHSAYVSALLLNLANPTTVLSFLAVLAVLKLNRHEPWWLSLLVVSGILAGAMLWWLIVAVTASHFRDRMDDRALRKMNRIAGVALGAFGLAMLALSA